MWAAGLHELAEDAANATICTVIPLNGNAIDAPTARQAPCTAAIGTARRGSIVHFILSVCLAFCTDAL